MQTGMSVSITEKINEKGALCMSNIQIFKNGEFGTVRTVEMNNEVYFVGKDVAKALGYAETANMRKLIDDCDYIEINPQSKEFTGFVQNGATLEPNKNIQRMLLINESGLYMAVFGSKLPTAKKFKHWVTSEVLPAIRKHGVYAVDEVLNNPDMLITALQELKAEREKRKMLEETAAVQRQQITEMQPKASYYDVVLNCKDLVAISTISKDYGWSATKMNNYLHSKGVQYKQGEIWLLYQKYAAQGFTSTKVHSYNGSDGEIHTRPHTYWTQKGRLFIYSLLKADGIMPLIEQD